MAASAWLSFLALCLGPRSSVAVQMPRVVAVPVTVPAGRAASARNSDVAAGAAGAAAWQAVGAKKAGVAYLGSDLPWDSCSAVGGCEVDAGLSIGGQRYSKGIFAHADSSIAFTLGGAYEKFHACFGIAELVDTGCGVSSGETSFVVKLDGDSVYEETNDASDPPYCIIVDVTQKMKMELLTISGTTAHCDHSAWFDARVTRSAASPSTKSPAASLAKEAAGAALAPAPAGRAASAQKGALSLLGSGAPAGAVGAAARPAGRAAAKAKKETIAYLGSDLPYDSCSALSDLGATCLVDSGLTVDGQFYSKSLFGEFLGFVKDEPMRKHLPDMFSLIKNGS